MATPRSARPHRYPVKVRLTCGCVVRTRMAPYHKSTKFGCTSGLGHGYTLGWTEWTDEENGSTRANWKTA